MTMTAAQKRASRKQEEQRKELVRLQAYLTKEEYAAVKDFKRKHNLSNKELILSAAHGDRFAS